MAETQNGMTDKEEISKLPEEEEKIDIDFFETQETIDSKKDISPDTELTEAEEKFFGTLKSPPNRPKKQRKISIFEKRRRVKLQARRVRRIIRHIEVWSVLKISILFYACLWAIFLIAGFLIWGVAESSGTVGKLESLITELFALDTFTFDGKQIFRGYALGGLVLAIAGSTMNVLMCLIFNLISDLTGGLRITMIEEETVRPSPPRRLRRRNVR
ncbi:MAG: DUF3566 domain-containing protein [Acidimicrobiales bacterium]|nr:DUF3566 domain-containing protein [Acidimicrobiales bacterium]|tara:strand:- start:5022 stop:5666 length:645 start_codon:yes stop_codon:yes gene_type:complete